MLSLSDRTPRDRISQGSTNRARVTRPSGGSSLVRRRGLTLVELVLVVAALAGVLIGGHYALEFQPDSPGSPLTSGQRSTEELPPLTDVAIAPNQKEAVSVGMNGMLRIHDLKTRDCIAEVRNKFIESRSVCYSPDGNQLLVSSLAGHLELWSFAGEQATSRTRRANEIEVSVCLFTRDGRQFVTCGGDLSCTVWDAATFTPVGELAGIDARIRRACFTTDGTHLFAGDVSGHVNVWNLSTRKLVQRFPVIDQPYSAHANVNGLAVLPGDTEVLAAAQDGTVGVWNVQSGRVTRRFQSDGRRLTSLCLLKDGSRAISGDHDGQITVWNVATGARLQSFCGHTGPVQALAIADDQKTVVSAGWDGQLKFWEI